ncbi:MAG: protein BatD [Anaerolineae bacterium]|nr:protein BatD [Anaerolineae bacterium]
METFGGKIHMQNVRDPKRVETALKEYWDRVTSYVKQAKDEEIRLEVRQRMGLDEPPKQAAPPTEKPTQASPVKKKSFLDDFLQIRVVDGDVITYRKHWFILLAKVWPVALVLFVLFWVIIARALSVIPYLTAWDFVVIFIAILLVSSPYWVYHYWDWKDDRYQLTKREVIDLERKPFQKEARDSAPLENILSIQHSRENIIELIFNFGTVAINAGNKELTFDNIYNPAAVQNEIFEQRLRRVNQVNDEKERGTRAHIEKLVDYYAENLPEFLDKKQKENLEK